jgi:hypothetical protein
LGTQGRELQASREAKAPPRCDPWVHVIAFFVYQLKKSMLAAQDLTREMAMPGNLLKALDQYVRKIGRTK